jgi:hypothetical protein
MSNLIALTCPSCGGRLEVTNNTERYVCAQCGNSHIVDPGVRAESLANEVELLKYNDQIRQVEAKIESLMQQQSQARQAYGVAEEAAARQRSYKQGSLPCVGVGLIVILIALTLPYSSSTLVFTGIGLLILGIIIYFVVDDAEALAAQASVMQQIEASRDAIQQQQRELAQLRMEQASKRLEAEARSPARNR